VTGRVTGTEDDPDAAVAEEVEVLRCLRPAEVTGRHEASDWLPAKFSNT